MRPPAVEKMGYYPTSDVNAELIATYFKPAATGLLLDPCCGTGQAASIIAKKLGCTSWGSEISPQRAKQAEGVMDLVLNAPWANCSLSPGSITFLFLNPPYNHDRFGVSGRLEMEFLKSCTSKLIAGGVMVYIVPHKLMYNDDVATHLAAFYEPGLRMFEYIETQFDQVIIFAVKRPKYKVPTTEEIQVVRNLAKAEPEKLVPATEPLYVLLPTPAKNLNGTAIKFTLADYAPEEMVDLSVQYGVVPGKDWRELMDVKRGVVDFAEPVMPLKTGHIAMLMASGMMGILRLHDSEGKSILVKGRVVKTNVMIEEKKDENDKVTAQVWRDKFTSTVAVLSEDGVEIIDKVEPLAKFMQTYGDQIGAYILANYQPLYGFDPTEHETQVLESLGKNRKPLFGQEKPGLLTTQKHIAAAVARSVKKHGVGNIQGEMGVGKTTVGAAVVELLDAYPAIVMCPPHLVPKWIREIKETIPGVEAVELARIGKNASDKMQMNDVRLFLDNWKHGKLGKKAIAVVAHTSAKLGAGWELSYVKRKTHFEEGSRTELACPGCGHPIMIEGKGDLRYPAVKEEDIGRQRMTCQEKVKGWTLDDDGKVVHDANGMRVWGDRPCGTPLHSFVGTRWSLSDYIAQKAKRSFKMLIADEVHQFKSKSSDRGISFHQLIGATDYTLTLTGTFFGGTSTSIFWLLHRLNSSVRRDYGFNDEHRWATRYGVLETLKVVKKSRYEDYSGYTGNKRWLNKVRERPGVSPAIITRLLDTTVFISLKDLGLALPHYGEKVVTLDMEPEQNLQYSQMFSELKAVARKNHAMLSSWLQWSLARPNSGFRHEVVMEQAYDEEGVKDGMEVLMQLPPVFGEEARHPDAKLLSPKEQWLINFIQTERTQGRKVLIYMRQTGTRDIQDRLRDVLRAGKLKVEILHHGVAPRKREEWINTHSAGLDALIVNPRLVETGLDLVMFKTVTFFEIEYSLYTLWQAVRRVWRLGQDQPVQAVFSVFKNTMEATALALMGHKMKAAQLLYGDEVAGAIVPEEEGDLMMRLAREAIESSGTIKDLQRLFADDVEVSHNPLGNMTAASAIIDAPPAETPGKTVLGARSWDEWRELHAVDFKPKKVKPRVSVDGQSNMFEEAS